MVIFDVIWAGIMLAAVVTGGVTGRMQQVSQSMIAGASAGLEIFFLLLAVMCLWNGMMEIAVAGGFSDRLCRMVWPLVSRIFPGVEKGSPAARAITMNVTANILGLGNAATPAGLQAMDALARQNTGSAVPSDNMVTFVVLNSVSIQLVPTGVAALRTKYGATDAMDIMPAVWVASAVSVLVGVGLALLIPRLKLRSAIRSRL